MHAALHHTHVIWLSGFFRQTRSSGRQHGMHQGIRCQIVLLHVGMACYDIAALLRRLLCVLHMEETVHQAHSFKKMMI